MSVSQLVTGQQVLVVECSLDVIYCMPVDYCLCSVKVFSVCVHILKKLKDVWWYIVPKKHRNKAQHASRGKE